MLTETGEAWFSLVRTGSDGQKWNHTEEEGSWEQSGDTASHKEKLVEMAPGRTNRF